MNVLLVSGIWPPDVGGPASHAPELAAFLHGRGHRVAVVTTADDEPAAQPYRVDWISRALPVGVRHAAMTERIRSRARGADVIYATSVAGRAALGATLARKPFVVKLTTDDAFERATRLGLFTGDMDEFQSSRGSPAVAVIRLARNTVLGRAARVVCPSAYLRDVVLTWGIPPDRLAVVPNPAPPVPSLPTQAVARAALGVDGSVLAFAGRVGPQKALPVALEALAQTANVTLLVAGDGPDREAVARRAGELGLDARVRFLGPLPREQVLELFRAADATILSSAWENFPHAVVESLAVGTPVISTSVGGVSEVIEDGVNGLLVPPGDPVALGSAIERFFHEPGLQERLRGAAARDHALDADAVFGRIEELLEAARR